MKHVENSLNIGHSYYVPNIVINILLQYPASEDLKKGIDNNR
jgi:hypothetical protein